MKKIIAALTAILAVGIPATRIYEKTTHSSQAEPVIMQVNRPLSDYTGDEEVTYLEYDRRDYSSYGDYEDYTGAEEATYLEYDYGNYSSYGDYENYSYYGNYDNYGSYEPEWSNTADIYVAEAVETEWQYEETVQPEADIYDLRAAIVDAIIRESYTHPYGTFAVGVYDIWNNWEAIAEVNPDAIIFSGCQVKNSFVCWALAYCQNNNIDIYNTFISDMSLYELFFDTLYWSNVGNANMYYGMLVDYFGVDGFSNYQTSIGGQYVDRGVLFGSTSVRQKKNEWIQAYNFMTSGTPYGFVLSNMNGNTNFSYIANGLSGYYDDFHHKSGWCEEPDYTCSGDSAIIGHYFVSIQTMNADTSSVTNISSAIEPYLY